ncbi:MAG TPA: type II secretion system protein N [Ramlibacter sp.]|nr:type II secretion system protein N [Ramlibacter sp.]
MVTTLGSRWAVAGSTFALWALVAASAAYWGLKLSGGDDVATAPPAARSPAPADPAAVARVLGSSPTVATAAPPPSAGSRFALVGVVANRGHGGAALVSIDGKPPKPFRVGTAVEEGLVLQSVDARRAVLAPSMDAPPSVTLELPLLHK